MAFSNDAERIAYEADIARKLKAQAGPQDNHSLLIESWRRLSHQPEVSMAWKIFSFGTFAVLAAGILVANLQANHRDSVQKAKTKVVAPVVTPVAVPLTKAQQCSRDRASLEYYKRDKERLEMAELYNSNYDNSYEIRRAQVDIDKAEEIIYNPYGACTEAEGQK